MKTAEEYYHEYCTSNGSNKDDFIRFLNKARKETIEECSRVATVSKVDANTEALLQQGYNAPLSMYNQPRYFVDKQSILSLIDELK